MFIYIVYTLPASQIPPAVARANDKLLHFLTFFILTLFGFRAFSYSSFNSVRRWGECKTISFSLFYGAYLEWAQRSVPGREMSFADFVADSFGTFAAFLIFLTPLRPKS